MHDKDGKPLRVGDKVTIEYEIVESAATEDYCNLKVKTVLPFYPDVNRFDTSWVNSKQTSKVE